MKQLISAMFDDYQAATNAVQRLKSAGIPSDDISIVGGNQEMRSGSAPLSTDEGSAAGTGAATGAVVGGGAGLLAGLGLLAIPGLGPVVAAGWLASTLAGAAVGTAAGGLIGGLTEWGMSEEEAHGYAEGVRRGGTLVTARVEDAQIETAVQILDADGTVDMNERTEGWRREGWQGTFGMGDRPAGTDSLAGAAGGRPVTESQPRAMPQSGSTRTAGSIPVVEEAAERRQAQSYFGPGPRAYARPPRQPAEASVRLHDEKVRIERTPVNQPLTAAGHAAGADHRGDRDAGGSCRREGRPRRRGGPRDQAGAGPHRDDQGQRQENRCRGRGYARNGS